MDTSYLATTRDVYRQAALNPQQGLCCTTTPVWQLPELAIPKPMLAMNYGCGSTVNPRDLVNNPAILYVGVGGGMEFINVAEEIGLIVDLGMFAMDRTARQLAIWATAWRRTRSPSPAGGLS